MANSLQFQAGGIGLVLSGGGARGLAHIGVLKVIERQGVPIASIAGTSMGGVIAALYAAGWDADSLEHEALRMASIRELIKLVDIRPPRRGLLAGQNVRAYLAEFIGPELTFEDLKAPLALKAVDLNTGHQVDLKSGNLLDAVLATSAFPGVFPHVEIGDHHLVDGGVLNNLPLDLVDQTGASQILAVDVSPCYPDNGSTGTPLMIEHLPLMAQDVYRSVMLMLHALTEARIERRPPDLLIRPEIAWDIGIFTGFSRAEEIIRAGESAAEHQQAEIDRLLTNAARFGEVV
jgi:NTE family protein